MPDTNLAPQTPFEAQQAALNRQRALAQMLQQQAFTAPQQQLPPGVKAPGAIEAITRALSGFLGSRQNAKLDKQQQSLTGNINAQDLAQSLGAVQAVMPSTSLTPDVLAGANPSGIPGMENAPAQIPANPSRTISTQNAVAQAAISPNSAVSDMAKALMGSALTGSREQQDRVAQAARQLDSQNFTANRDRVAELGETQRLDKTLANQQGMTDAEIKSREKIAALKEPPVKNPGYRDVETNGRIIREYFDQSDPSTVTYSKDLSPVTPHANPATAADNALESSSQHNLDNLSKQFTPITASLQKIAQGQSLMAANNPAANSLVAPTILEALVSGQGTGFRMTQPEIDSINKGQGKVGNFQNWLSAWAVDPEKYTALNADQKKWLNGVLELAKQKASAKVDVYEKASDLIINGKTKTDHQRAYRDALTSWAAIDSGNAPKGSTVAAPAAKPPTNVIRYDNQGNRIP